MSSISNKRAKTVHQLTSEELSENIASNIQSLLELQRTKESEFNEKSRTFDEKCAAKMQSEKEKAEKLIADAKKKAEDASRIAGFKLGKVINYSEGQGGFYPPVMAMGRAEDAKVTNPTQIQPGTNEIMVTVTLSYEIR